MNTQQTSTKININLIQLCPIIYIHAPMPLHLDKILYNQCKTKIYFTLTMKQVIDNDVIYKNDHPLTIIIPVTCVFRTRFSS